MTTTATSFISSAIPNGLQTGRRRLPSHTRAHRNRQHARQPVTCAKRSILTSRNSLLPKLVPIARGAWRAIWRILMSELAPSDAEGRYVRPPPAAPPPDATPTKLADAFAERADPAPPVLYLGVACPWCHRVALAVCLLGLADSVDVRAVQPGLDGLWALCAPADGLFLLKDVYIDLLPAYAGRFTAPLLVDADRSTIVSNESADIVDALARRTGPVHHPAGFSVALSPCDLPIDWTDVQATSRRIYEHLNDGVYRCGFATSQLAYDEAESALIDTLQFVDDRLQHSRFLCSDTVITQADVFLLPTIVRFDAVYAPLFRIFRKSVRSDFPAVRRWLADLYHISGVRDSCDVDATVRQYFSNLFPLNPSGIVPATPRLEL